MNNNRERDQQDRVELWMNLIESLALNMRITKREAAELIAAEIRSAAQNSLKQDGVLPAKKFS